MASILIPFSGGTNSSFALWNWLSNTSHDITAVYAEEDWVVEKFTDGSAKNEAQKTASDAIVSWLKSNVRDFAYETTTWPVSYSEDFRPIREGFEYHVDVGLIEPRYKGYRQEIDNRSPDGIVVGISVENTATDTHNRFRSLIEVDGVDIYLAGSPDFTSVQKGDSFDYDAVAATLTGRFEQFEDLPEAVCNLFVTHPDPDYNDNTPFHPPSFYQEVRKTRTDMTGAEIDAAYAEAGQYGKWRSDADPETYQYRGDWLQKSLDLLGKEIVHSP
tara:strand:- start:24 stop:842 length:819 start_codon:yes stop_codon:yes gene_type:complete